MDFKEKPNYCEIRFEEIVMDIHNEYVIQLGKNNQNFTNQHIVNLFEAMNQKLISLETKFDNFNSSLFKLENKVEKIEKITLLLEMKDINNVCVNEQKLIGHDEAVYSLIKLSSTKIASAGSDTLVKIWDLKSEKLANDLKGHTKSIWCLLKLNDNQIASGSRDTTIRLWCLLQNNCIGILKGHTDTVYCIIVVGENTSQAVVTMTQ